MPENLEDIFPNLSGYQITSPASLQYNCVSWALNITTEWWSHDATWPMSVTRSPDAGALVPLFETLGYEVCDSDEREVGYEKVAIYARSGEWTHAARQLEDGQWTSKLGPFEDITHPSLENLAGETFGSVHCIMRRPSSTP